MKGIAKECGGLKMKLVHRVNTDRKFGEALCYYYTQVQHTNGEKRHALFTEKEVKAAEVRAAKQTEDVPNGIGSLWGRLLKWFS